MNDADSKARLLMARLAEHFPLGADLETLDGYITRLRAGSRNFGFSVVERAVDRIIDSPTAKPSSYLPKFGVLLARCHEVQAEDIRAGSLPAQYVGMKNYTDPKVAAARKKEFRSLRAEVDAIRAERAAARGDPPPKRKSREVVELELPPMDEEEVPF